MTQQLLGSMGVADRAGSAGAHLHDSMTPLAVGERLLSFPSSLLEAPIGLFDSGLGGLTVLHRLRSRQPTESLLYLADTARFPYGGRTTAELRTIAVEVAAWMRRQGIKALLTACNTTNAVAIAELQRHAGVPVVGLISAAAAVVDSASVGVLATAATVASGAYGQAIRHRRGDARVVEVACPDLVPLIETGDLDSPELMAAAKRYLTPLLEQGVDTIVLGCTHYPLLTPQLQQLLPPGVRLLDPAVPAVEVLAGMLRRTGLRRQGTMVADRRLVCTGCPERFASAAEPWLGHRPGVSRVNLRMAHGGS